MDGFSSGLHVQVSSVFDADQCALEADDEVITRPPDVVAGP